MAIELMSKWITQLPTDLYPKDINVRVVDGTHISEPGSTGSDWGIHYSIKLSTLQCDEIKGYRYKNERDI